MTKIIQGDCREVLKTLPDGSVDCCVTSPPYLGLRDYNVSGQIGLEQTPDEYVEQLVAVFREVRRVLADDGTLWLNLAPSYSNAVPNMADCVNRVLKGCSIFGFDAETVASSAKRVAVAAHDKRTPDGKLFGLLGVEWESVEQRNDYFREVVDCFAVPRNRRTGVDCVADLVLGGAAATDTVQDVVNGAGVVFADLDANLQAELAVLRATGARSGHGDDTPFAVKETGEPRTKCGVAWHSAWDSFALASGRKGIPDVDLVNQAVALRNGALSFACMLRDFEITQASEQKITFTSVGGGVRLVVSDVGHLMFSFVDGCLIPYRALYDKAARLSNRNCAKQEIDTPNMVKMALQEDGWICRQTIIWHKSNPMPESVKDRCTKAHEYIFLLSKSPKYYFDNEAIMEPAIYGEQHAAKATSWGTNRKHPNKANVADYAFKGDNATCYKKDDGRFMKNKRSVWTVTTKPYKGSHFATFPPALIAPMILAGCPVGGKVLDPFGGSGTTGEVSESLGRNSILIELNPDYIELQKKRTAQMGLGLCLSED
jgi:DNA modification methylase